MSSTSKKHRNFIAEPIRGKRVTELPGIGETLGERLSGRGYNTADKVLGQYLVMDRDRRSFERFLRKNCNANSKQVSDCYNGLDTWSKEFL
ncbi:unnamed protein product [Arctia plantaginis]|uniref:Barrier-to-autointegration factor n=1 Tax=Arctia plantaginis TaxID=874455 RepID=A0A8S1BJ94_ARCPL|nr:unnamed protein product [Arctia plantaginis]